MNPASVTVIFADSRTRNVDQLLRSWPRNILGRIPIAGVRFPESGLEVDLDRVVLSTDHGSIRLSDLDDGVARCSRIDAVELV